jgi:hypothetical protein
MERPAGVRAMRVNVMPQPTALEVVASAATGVQVRPTWVPAPRPNNFLEGFAPIGEVMKTVSLDSTPDGVLGLTISGVALARRMRDHDDGDPARQTAHAPLPDIQA